MSAASGDGVRPPSAADWERICDAAALQPDASVDGICAVLRSMRRWLDEEAAESQRLRDALAAVSPAAPTAPGDDHRDLLYEAWGLIANASDWERERPDWQEAAVRWRDRWHVTLPAPAAGGSPAPDAPTTTAPSPTTAAPSSTSEGSGAPYLNKGAESVTWHVGDADGTPQWSCSDGASAVAQVNSLNHRRSGSATLVKEATGWFEVVRLFTGTPAPDGSDDAEVWIPPVTDCMDSQHEPCPHCGSTWHHMRTDRCGQCGRRPAPSVDALTEAVGRLADRWIERARRNFADACGLPSSDYNAEEFRRLNELADDYAERAAELRALLSAPGVTRSEEPGDD